MKIACHVQMEPKNKRIKINTVMTNSFSLQKHITKRLHDKFISIINTYINPQTQPVDLAITQSYTLHKPHTRIIFLKNKYYLLKPSMVDK